MSTSKAKHKIEKTLFVFFIFHALFNMAISVSFEGAYNTYYPVMLQGGNPDFGNGGDTIFLGFGLSAFMTGVVMSLDNVIGIIFVPIFGAMGDKSLRRKEITVITAYIGGALFATFPMIAKVITPENNGRTELLMLPLAVFVMTAVTMAFVSKMSGAYRNGYIFSKVSKDAQGVLQSFAVIAGAIGFIIATSLSSYLYTLDTSYPFYVGAAGLLIVPIFFQIFAPVETEKNEMLKKEYGKTNNKFVNPLLTIKEVFMMLSKEDKLSMLMIVLVQNLGKFGIIALQTFFSSWMLNKLGLGPNIAALATVIFFVCYLLACFPMGFIVDRVDKSKLYAAAIFLTALAAMGTILLAKDFMTISIFCGLFGIALSIFDVLTIPYAMSFVPEGSNASGTIISLILTVLGIFGIVIVPLCGFLIDVTKDYNTLFYSTFAAALIALIPLGILNKLKHKDQKA